MLHIGDVDQSGKIEDTQMDTVLALANGMSFCVCIPAIVKRACIKELRYNRIPASTFYLQLYVTGLYYLLKKHMHSLSRILIDNEYMGKERQIKEYLTNLLVRSGHTVERYQIQFGYVGKHSPAHILAWRTRRKLLKPNLILTATQMLGEFHITKKIGDSFRRKT